LACPDPLPDAARLHRIIHSFRGARVLAFADLVVDRFLTGHPRRISREAPVLILELEDDRLLPGGGANAAANVRALGGEPVVFGAVGDDAGGAALCDELRRRGIDVSRVERRAGWVTPTKTRILGGGATGMKQQIVRLDSGRPRQATAAEQATRIEAIRSELEAHSGTERTVIMLNDYGYGAVDPELLRSVRAIAGPEPLVLVDSRYRLGEYRGLSAATPNQEEAEGLCGRGLDQDQDLLRAGPEIREKLDAEFLLVTRGSRGMVLFDPRGQALLIPVHGSDQVADVTGAGDTVIGTLALALAAGASPAEAALLANFAGGVVVTKLGTATVSPSELEAAVEAGADLEARARWVAC
jgi:rfaE bifunctional protein kinase chain/domain